jgi:hypothetical protein
MYKHFQTWFSKYWLSYKSYIIINWTTVVLLNDLVHEETMKLEIYFELWDWYF